MQNFFNHLSKGFVISALLITVISLYSCGAGRPGEAELRRFEETKLAAIEQINTAKTDLQNRIAIIDTELKNATGQAYEELQIARAELVAEVEKLEGELVKIQESTIGTWDQVVEEASTTIQEAQTQAEELTGGIREWLNPVQE